MTSQSWDDLKRMAVFASVVRHGSMSAAARALGMTPSAVSQQVRQLEHSGGVTLLHRSTRKLRLTEVGERYHAQCAAMAAAAQQARDELAASREQPGGELRMSAPVGFGRHIAPALGPLLQQHPGLRLRLLVDDARIDLIEARVDLAIRFGPLPDSGWAARRLGAMQWWLCAAPGWLTAHGSPADVAALTALPWVGFSREPGGLRLELRSPDGVTHPLQVQPRMASNNQLSIQQMCEGGLGVALLGSMDVHESLQAGRLVRLWPDWSFGTLDLWAVTPQRETQPAKVRHAVHALQAYLRQLPGVLD
ncbi:LysR family transcriptional regulator [Acidovorax lacteus]|uniref:LysR family transcriptional regulator n=1 Tax=Acidovorax lacteus TaxID=1924988 RepID=A0ABP8L4F8_9BURK